MSVNTFIDGKSIANVGAIPAREAPALDWTASAANLAFDTAAGVATPARLTGPLGGFELAGGSNGPVLANDRPGGRAEFLGSMTFVTLWTRALNQDEASCLFTAQNQHIEVCEAPDTANGRELPGTEWRETLTADSVRSDVVLGNDAWFDPGYGLTLDGNDDFLAIQPAPTYTDDSTFTISFWYTRTQCSIPGRYETLYSQHQSWVTGAVGSRESVGSAIDLVIGCNDSDDDQMLTGQQIPGAVIRASLRDNDGNRAGFEIPLLLERDAMEGGFVSDMWAHFVLTVTTTGVQTYVFDAVCFVYTCRR